MLTIRPILLKEVENLTAVARDIFLKTFLPDNNPADVKAYVETSLTTSTFSSEIQNPLFYTSGVFWQDELIGYIQLHQNPREAYEGSEFELKRFYLADQHQGKGIAGEMMKFCVSEALRLNYKKMWLGVWEKNFRALRFYEKMGFQKVSSHQFVMGQETQTDLILIKNIAN